MESPTSRPDEFSFRLAQWLLDQLNSEDELKTVTQQFNVLISQAQISTIGELYEHIGRLIFHKFTSSKTQSAPLCARLCRSLFMANLKQRSGLSTRPILIHEHLFRCCLDHLSSHDPVQQSVPQKADGSADGSSERQPETQAADPSDGEGNPIVGMSSLVLELHRYGLISSVQVYEYMFQLTSRPRSRRFISLLDAVYILLDGCFSRLDAGLWEDELDLFRDWVTSSESDAGIDHGHRERTRQLTNLLNRILNREQGPDTISEDPGLDFRRPSVSVSTPAQQTSSGQDASSVAKDDECPPELNNIITDSEDATQPPQSPDHEVESPGTPGNNFGAYTHGRRLAGPRRSANNANEAIKVPALNVDVHHSQPQRYGHSVHPFALIDTSEPEHRPKRPTRVYPQNHFSSSESSFSSAGSTSALLAPSPSPLSSAVATIMLNKKQRKDRLAKVVESRVDQERKGGERPDRVKRSKEDSVLDWLERESTVRGSLDRGKGR